MILPRWSLAQFALAGAFLCFVVIDVQLILVLMDRQRLGLDFLPLWTAARLDPGRVYDFVYVTLQQDWQLEHGLRPFVNPPTTLLLLQGFGALPFNIAYPTFMIVSIAIFALGAKRLGADWRICLIPHFAVLAILVGQVTFLVGGLVMTALTMRGRPALSGVLLGIVGAIKPQMLVLLPIALLAERNWRTMIATGLTAIALMMLTLVNGASWSEWLRALPQFQAYITETRRFLSMSASPYAFVGPVSLFATVPVAASGVWLAFRQNDTALRVLALLGGALLVAPYALNYELTLLIPAILSYEKQPRWSLVFWAVLLLNLSSVVALGVAILLLWLRLGTSGAVKTLVATKVRGVLSRPMQSGVARS
jgi:hypothetical protein